ncbi:DUF1329 domain-containing protein [Thermodesulfobacteriota bacterium]
MTKNVFVSMACVMMVWIVGPVCGFSAEITFPTYSYEGEQLQKVKEWEKTWAGKKISTENIDQVKEYVHEALYKAVTDPQLLGAKTHWFTVVPYRPYAVSNGVIDATKRYAPTSKLDEDEMLTGYGKVAGYPFPQPKRGIEMAWNFAGNTRGDSHKEYTYGPVVNCRTKNERQAGFHRSELYWVGRTDLAPLPSIPPKRNPRGIARSWFQRQTAPVDFVDTTILSLQYLDHKRQEDLWVYTVMFRRIRRYSASQRTDSIDGTDMIFDDQDGWYTHMTHNTYEYKGRGEFLVGRHLDAGKLQRVKGQGFWDGVQRERVNHWIVEVKNRDDNYVYNKQIWYLDPENWQMSFKVMYNRQGQLWKMYELFYDEYPLPGGGKAAVFCAEQIFDLIRNHGTCDVRELKEVGKDMPLEFFQTSSLKQKSY